MLLTAAGLGIGGAEVVIQRLAQSLDRERFEVAVCCLKSRGTIGDALVAEGVEVVVLSEGHLGFDRYLTFHKLLKLIRARRIDVVHTHTADALRDAAICRLLRRSVRLVHTFHFGNYPNRDASRKRFERFGSRIADRLVAVGENQRRQLMATYGFGEEEIVRIRNGVTLGPAGDTAAFRQSIGVTDQLLVGVTATLIEQKGLYDFLEVASRFRDEADRIRFVIIGEGALRGALEQKCRDLRLGGSVVLAGWVPDAAVCAVPAFDIFFQPSLWEAMSIALLEAMGQGKPIVATRVGEAPHIVDDGVDGLLVAPRDVDAMTAAIRRLCDNPDERGGLGRAAASKVARRFMIGNMIAEYEQLYLEIAHGSPRIR